MPNAIISPLSINFPQKRIVSNPRVYSNPKSLPPW